jgi:hypothetical protein
MAHSEEDPKTPHAPGSQPSTSPGSDEPQTITAPTPPVARTTGPPTPDDLADEGGEGGEGPETASEDD